MCISCNAQLYRLSYNKSLSIEQVKTKGSNLHNHKSSQKIQQESYAHHFDRNDFIPSQVTEPTIYNIHAKFII